MTVITFDTEKVYGNTVMYTLEAEELTNFNARDAAVKACRQNADHLVPSAYQEGTILILSGYQCYPFVLATKETDSYGYISWYYIPLPKQYDDALELVKFWEKNKDAILFTNMALFSGKPTEN